MNALALAYVAVGGAVGSMARYAVQWLYARHFAVEFPAATLTVNVFGSFLMGVWLAAVMVMMPGKARELHLLFAIGALGGFTTFSSFSMDVFLLFERGLLVPGLVYIVASVLLSILALIGGVFLVRFFA